MLQTIMLHSRMRFVTITVICSTFAVLWIVFFFLISPDGWTRVDHELKGENSFHSSNCGLKSSGQTTKWLPPDEWRPEVKSKCNSDNCKPPECFCAGTRGPLKLDRNQIPQMVMLTFDDGINKEVHEYFNKLLSKPRLNPNGCPVTLTFYLSHTWTNHVGDGLTDYGLVRELYDAGHEIASHSISHLFPQDKWKELSKAEYRTEFGDQRHNIVTKAGIPESDVRGMRIPFLKQAGDNPYKMMMEEGLKFDATCVTGPHDDGGAWPYTLDYGIENEFCIYGPRAKSTYPGKWELPLNRWIGPDGEPCVIVDYCETQPKDRNEALGYMRYNFNRFYNRNRAPFGIHIHVAWFEEDISYFQALEEFLDELSRLDDVYLVSASQVIDWMRDPQTVNGVKHFKPWLRSCEKSGM